MPELVIFAVEGVLVDSIRAIAEAQAETLKAAGVSISAEEIVEEFDGLPFRDLLLALEKRAEVPLQASLIEAAEARTGRKLRKGVPAVDGAREALGRASSRCAVTGAPLELADAMLAAAGLKPFLPKAVFSSAALKLPARPAPDLLLHAAEAMKADADACFVVESSPAGIRAAKAAGMRAVGFSGGSHAYPGLADKLTEAGAETVVRRLADLRGVLAALSEWSLAD